MYPDEPTDEILLYRARQKVWSSPWFTVLFSIAIPVTLLGIPFCIAVTLVMAPLGALGLLSLVAANVVFALVYRREVRWSLIQECQVRDGERCPECLYDLRSIPTAVCPECGCESEPRRRILAAAADPAGTPAVSGPV